MKRLSLITEFDELYKGSDLQKIVNNNPLPIKYTIDGFDCFFYNADLFGLFEMKVTKEGITPNDFIKDYKNGFMEGLEYLKKEAKIKIKDLKNTNLRDGTVKQMQNILFEREFQFGSKGLINLVFNKPPLIFTDKNIYEFGYWNGIIHSIENLCEKTGLNENDLKLLPADNTFLDFIHNVRNKEDFANDLKNTFNIEIGSNLRNMYQQLELAKIIVLLDSQMRAFHTAMKSYFDRDIGSYEAFRKNSYFNVVAISRINLKLKPLIEKHKINLESCK